MKTFADATNDDGKIVPNSGGVGGGVVSGGLPLPPIFPPMPSWVPNGYQYFWVDGQGWVLFPSYNGVNQTYPATHQNPVTSQPIANTVSGFFATHKPLVYLGLAIGALFFLDKK